MDAAIPLRLLLVAALVPLIFGCHGRDAQPIARPQSPAEMTGPLPPAVPSVPTPFKITKPPIQGLPVLPTPIGKEPVSASAPGPGAPLSPIAQGPLAPAIMPPSASDPIAPPAPTSAGPASPEPQGPIAPTAPVGLVPPPNLNPTAPAEPMSASAPKPPETAATPNSSQTVQTSFSQPHENQPGSIKSSLPTGEPRICIAAFVGSANHVTVEEVREACKQRLYQKGMEAAKIIIDDKTKWNEAVAEEFRRIIERELIIDDMYARLKKAKKMNVIEEIKEAAEKTANSRIRDLRRGNRSRSDDELRINLESVGLTIPVLRRQYERDFISAEYVRNITREKIGIIGLKEIRAYYESHPDEFRIPDRVKWLDIFVSVGKFETEKQLDPVSAKRAAYDYASIIQMHAEAGEDFPALSRKYDDGLAGQVNGIGLGSDRGAIQPPEVEPIVWTLKVGEVSKLIESPAGYHIVKVVERDHAGIKPFDDKVQLEAKRRYQHAEEEVEYKRMVDKLWRLGVVKIIEMP